MYKERIHLTVRDADGWTEVLAVVDELNTICSRLKVPTATAWTETVGVFNQLTLEIEHDSLAAYESNTKAWRDEPETPALIRRLGEATVEGKGWSELLERAVAV